MKPEEAKAALSRTVKQTWPNVARASELPFPDYWKRQTEWLTFHAPHIGEKMVDQIVAGMIVIAQEAVRTGQAPKPWIVPEKVKEIWRKVKDGTGAAAASPSSAEATAGKPDKQNNEAWEHAAELAADVKNRFTGHGRRRRILL